MTPLRAALLLFALCSALAAGRAAAAARFERANPPPEAILPIPPARVDIYTVRPTSPQPGDTQVIVLNGDRHRVDRDDSTVDASDHHHVSVTLQEGLGPGRYIVSFKTRGEIDLDHDGGEYAFYVVVQPTAAERSADAALSLTTLGGEDVLHGYQRGFVEGLLTFAIGGPIALYFTYRRYQKRKTADKRGLPDTFEH